MWKSTSWLKGFLVVTICLLGYTPSAFAYVDPTAAGTMMQAAYVLAASALMSIVLIPKKLIAFFTGLKERVASISRRTK